jgi:hypothetical protein
VSAYVSLYVCVCVCVCMSLLLHRRFFVLTVESSPAYNMGVQAPDASSSTRYFSEQDLIFLRVGSFGAQTRKYTRSQ